MILKPPGNGIFKLLNFTGKRDFPMHMIRAVLRDGKRFCCWCAEKEIGPPPRKYCSTLCNVSFMVHAHPTKYPATEFIYLRQGGKCAHCKFPYRGLSCRAPENTEDENRRPEFDHIIPVALGGQTFGIDNIQLLCKTCHAIKTKKDVEDIRKARCSSSPEELKKP